MANVSIRNVSKLYPGGKGGDVMAVRDVSLEVADREFVVLVGPSGCGKSTILRMIAGLEDISRGEIYIGDRLVNDVTPRDRDIAMVFQNYALYPHMTVYENLAFGLKMRKFAKAEIRKRVTEAASMLGIEQLLQRKPKALSGGQRQRVAVGRAMVRQPKVFLFDEPLSNLDAKMRIQMRTEITKLHQRLQATMIYVTHDQVEAMTMGDRIVVMNNGVVQQHDAPLKLYNDPANLFVAEFLGSPPINIVRGTLEQAADVLVFREADGGTIDARLPVREHATAREFVGKRMILAFRPEEVEVGAPQNSAVTESTSFEAIIDVVEVMGAETNLYLRTGAHTLICRNHGPLGQYQIGQRVPVSVNLAKAHLFDPESTLRIA